MATRADLRFALPLAVRSAIVADGDVAWERALADGGLEQAAVGAADLVVGEDAEGGRTVLAGRGGAKRLRERGLATQLLLPLPSLHRPALVLPLARPHACAYALSRLSVPPSRAGVWRNRVVTLAIAARVPLPGTLAVAAAGTTEPFLVHA